jgi:excisionase family DNA binding protein
MMITVDDEYFTFEEVAEKLKVSTRSVKRWVAEGNLRVIRLSAQRGSVRIAGSDLREFLQARASRPKREKD